MNYTEVQIKDIFKKVMDDLKYEYHKDSQL